MKKLNIFILLVSLPVVGGAMSFFSKQVLFSEVKGIVQKQGKPLVNVEVIRSYTELDNRNHESVKTDAQGQFNFSKVTKTLFFELGFFPPSEVVVSQDIILNYKGISYDAWVFVRDNYDNGSELGVNTINLICDISNEPKQLISKTGGVVYGICLLN